MTTTTVTLEDAPEYFGRLNTKYQKAAKRGLLRAAHRLKRVIVSEIIPSRFPQPRDRGIYRAGWQVEKIPEGAAVFNNEVHAVFIEHGVRAENVKIGKAMITALSEWASRKGLADDEDEAKSIAWAIAKTMQRRGIFNRFAGGTGLHILGEATEDHAPEIVGTEVNRVLSKL